MANVILNTCTVRDFDGQYYPRTMSAENIKILPDVEYPYTWVQIEETAEYDTEIFCILINGQFHQVQSIDFNF